MCLLSSCQIVYGKNLLNQHPIVVRDDPCSARYQFGSSDLSLIEKLKFSNSRRSAGALPLLSQFLFLSFFSFLPLLLSATLSLSLSSCGSHASRQRQRQPDRPELKRVQLALNQRGLTNSRSIPRTRDDGDGDGDGLPSWNSGREPPLASTRLRRACTIPPHGYPPLLPLLLPPAPAGTHRIRGNISATLR